MNIELSPMEVSKLKRVVEKQIAMDVQDVGFVDNDLNVLLLKLDFKSLQE